MKILLVSQVPPAFELKRLQSEIFPEFQAQAMWLKALRQLGHQVQVFLYTDPTILPKKLNAQLHQIIGHALPNIYNKYRLSKNYYYYFFPENRYKSHSLHQTIVKFKPDKIIISGGISDLVGSAISQAHQLNIPIYLLHGVNPQTGATHFEIDHLQLFDWIITNDPSHAQKWSNLGAKHASAVPYAGIDPGIHRRLKLTTQEYHQLQSDLVFVGTLFPDRQELFCKLLDLNINFKIWGNLPHGTKLKPQLTAIYQGDAWGKEAVKVYNATKIALNLVPPHMPVGGNMRTFEIPGSGAFQLTNRCPTSWYIPSKEIVIFNNLNDLKKKISWYLGHNQKRQAIAQTAYTKTHQLYTYAQRFKYILNL